MVDKLLGFDNAKVHQTPGITHGQNDIKGWTIRQTDFRQTDKPTMQAIQNI